MSQVNPYEAPVSNLEPLVSPDGTPLNPDWKIEHVLSEAWTLTNGFKASFWGAFLLYIGAIFLVSMAAGALTAGVTLVSPMSAIGVMVLVQIVQLVLIAPLLTGLLMMGIKRAAGLPVDAFMVLNYFPKTFPLFLCYLLMMLLVILGFALLVIPGVYLALAYAFALPLLVNKNLGVWQSLETSRKGITGCWFRFFGFALVGFIIVLLSAIPLGIGLIWTMPWLYVAMGVIYRDLFGVDAN